MNRHFHPIKDSIRNKEFRRASEGLASAAGIHSLIKSIVIKSHLTVYLKLKSSTYWIEAGAGLNLGGELKSITLSCFEFGLVYKP